MAAVHHARTRSARLAPSQAVTAVKSSHPPASTATSPAPQPISAPAPLTLFFRNVRLLDIDLLPDWPRLSAETFAPTGRDAQTQKRRVHGVEWALFQLFAYWDPDFTQTKLRPFFPPVDQVQSVNLRAAILRGLEQAKKNSVLGREVIIRKTMLDDCKGDRFEELLASFSSAVLKKVISDEMTDRQEHATPLIELCMEDRSYRDEKSDVAILGMIHKGALQNAVRRKGEMDERYKDFANFLVVKERKLDRRQEEIKERAEDTAFERLSEQTRDQLLRTVRTNWAGNDRWMNTLLYGDTASQGGDEADMPFDRVWRRVEQGRLSELEVAGTGLLEQLDNRVRVQKERMQKWDAFRRRMFGEQPPVSPSKKDKVQKQKKGIDLGFTAHEELQLGVASNRATLAKRMKLPNEYEELMSGLMEALQDDRGKKPFDFLKNYNPRRSLDTLSSSNAGEDAISELSEMDEEPEGNGDNASTDPPIKSFQSKLESAKRLPVRPKLAPSNGSRASSTGSNPFRRPIMDESDEDEQDTITFDMPSRTSSFNQQRTASRSRSPIKPTLSPPPASPEPPSPTQDMADQILNSMENASPSPMRRVKPRPTLSLADRARLSMARGSSADFLESEEPELPPMPGQAGHDEDLQTVEEDDGGPTDLASRTRKSMAGFEKAVQKAQMERRRSQRRSRLPPRRGGSQFPALGEEDNAPEESVLAEELMTEEDMEAVFRSRPKIQASWY